MNKSLTTMTGGNTQTKQDHETPDEFFQAVKTGFDIKFDLAANSGNTKCPSYFTPEDNALIESWVGFGWNWLNPEFKQIQFGWAEKCYTENLLGAKTVMLTPLITANWVKKWVYEKAVIIGINGRLKFVGEKDPYPKDLMLSVYFDALKYTPRKWFVIWDWKNQSLKDLFNEIFITIE